MTTEKSTVEQIRQRFDNDVERFSNLETGQVAIPDAVVLLESVAGAAAAVTPNAKRILDVGCGAGNFTLRLLQRLPNLHCTLLDLSKPMLDRAIQRVGAATTGTVHAVQSDIRDAAFEEASLDVIVAGASLHHLRTDAEWHDVFSRFHRWLRPGGSVWISDMIEHDHPGIQRLMWDRYGDYLVSLKGEDYRDHVFGYIRQEDTPRSLEYQLDLFRAVGFTSVHVLHKTAVFAAFGAVR